MESVLTRVHQAEVLAVQQAAEAWKVEHDEAMLVEDVRSAVQICLEFPEKLARLCRSMWDRTLAGHGSDTPAHEQQVRRLFATTLEAMAAIGEFGKTFREGGRPVERLEDLTEAIADIRRLRDEFFAEWPPVDLNADREAAAYPLSGSELKAPAEKHRPPQDWYEQTGKPF